MSRFVAIFILLCLPLAGQAEFSASVDRTQLNTNETLTLTLFTDRQVSAQALDLSALEQDFEILSTSPQSTLSIVNGRQSAEMRWLVTLLPRAAGTFTIPSFSLNGESTDSIQIEVAPGSRQLGDNPLALEVSLSDDEIYVNEELLLTVRLISAPGVSNISGEQMQLANGEARVLDQRSYSRVVNGANWRVNEWTYAVFSRTPGQLEVPAQTFSGLLGGASRSLFDPFANSGRRILARSDPQSVTVLDPPADADEWLPARDLSLEVVWSGNPDTLSVGEPMTRTIVATAIGQQAAALPPIETAPSPDYKVYADQPSQEEQATARGLQAERRDSAAIVPTRAGTIAFPEIRLRWWNIETETWEEAVVPRETIDVAAAAAADTPPPTAEPPDQDPTPEPTTDENPPGVQASADLPSAYLWLLGGLGALCLLLLADNWRLRSRNPVTPESAAKQAVQIPERARWQTLLKAVQGGNAAHIRSALLTWANQRWPHLAPFNLHGLMEKAPPELKAQLRAVEALCAGRETASLDASAMRQALLSWHETLADEERHATRALPEMYPH